MNELENHKSELSPFVGERRLITAAIAGDENAFSELYKQTYKGVYIIIKKYLSNDEDIYEAMQETYFKAYTNLSFLREPENFYNWLKIIAQNTAIDIIRSSKNDESFVDETIQSDYNEVKHDLNIEIADILKTLEPQYADLLIKIYYDGLRVREIAKLYKLPKSTVYSRLKTAESKLREMLEIRGIDGPLYTGDIASMLTISLRQIIGTDILKAAVMEEILQKVLNGDKGGKVVGALAKKKRNAAVLRLASIIMVFVVLVTASTVAIIENFKNKTSQNKFLTDMGVNLEEDYMSFVEGDNNRDVALVRFIDETNAVVIMFDNVCAENNTAQIPVFYSSKSGTYVADEVKSVDVKCSVSKEGLITLKTGDSYLQFEMTDAKYKLENDVISMQRDLILKQRTGDDFDLINTIANGTIFYIDAVRYSFY